MMDAPLFDRGRNAARKFQLIAAALLLAFGIEAKAEEDSRRPSIIMPPVLAPIKDADPEIRHDERIELPTKLAVNRADEDHLQVREGDDYFVRNPLAGDSISVSLDEKSIKPFNIAVGQKMIVGVRTTTFVYPEGEARPAQERSRGYSGGVGNLTSSAESIHKKRGSTAIKGKTYNYVVEMTIEVFETNLPPQHMWMPEGNKFKVLLTENLKEIVPLPFQLQRSLVDDPPLPSERMPKLPPTPTPYPVPNSHPSPTPPRLPPEPPNP